MINNDGIHNKSTKHKTMHFFFTICIHVSLKLWTSQHIFLKLLVLAKFKHFTTKNDEQYDPIDSFNSLIELRLHQIINYEMKQ